MKDIAGYNQWPDTILSIMEKNANRTLGSVDKVRMVRCVKQKYLQLSLDERVDVLVPDKAEYLSAIPVLEEYDELQNRNIYQFIYNWPERETVEGTNERALLQPTGLYDRVGNIKGKHFCPVNGDRVFSVEERALPYFIPENDIRKSPSYHQYTALNKNEYYGDVVEERGTIAPYGKGKLVGGGIQSRFIENDVALTVEELLERGVLYVCKK